MNRPCSAAAAGPFGWRSPVTALSAVLALYCAASLWRVTAILGLQVPVDPNEGWNAYQAAAAIGRGALYPEPGSAMVNNYPPLSFYLMGALGRLVGDDIVAGRIIALLSLLLLGLGLFAAARRMGCRAAEALFAPLFFVCGLVIFTSYVGMDDPQLLAQAVAIGGFLLLLHEPRGTGRVAAAAFLFVLAFFVKHNVIAMPLAMAMRLGPYDRRSAARLVVFGLSLLVGGLLLFRLVYGTGLLEHLVSARTYSLEDLGDNVLSWLQWGLVPLAGLAFLVRARPSDPYVRLCWLYGMVALVAGGAFLGGAGVDMNVMFDADIALALAGALVVRHLRGHRRAGLAAGAYLAPLVLGIWLDGDPFTADYWRYPMEDEASLAAQDIAFLKARPGPAICENLALCYWAGKPEGFDVFNIGEQIETGARGDDGLIPAIEAHRFAAIQLDDASSAPLGDDVQDAIGRAYRLEHSDDFGDFYVPR